MPESGLARKHASGLIDRLLPPFESSPTPTPPLFVNSSGTDKEDKREVLSDRRIEPLNEPLAMFCREMREAISGLSIMHQGSSSLHDFTLHSQSAA